MVAASKYSSHADMRGSEAGTSSEPPRYLAVGRVLRPWGVHGMVKVQVLTDFPERFTASEEFYVGEDYRPVILEQSGGHTGALLLKFAGYDTPEACGELRNQMLYIPTEEATPLQEGEYYIYQIIGLQVWTDEGELLGELTDVWETGANDVYVVDHEGRDVLLPAIPQVILDVDLERKRLTVHLMDGLMP